MLEQLMGLMPGMQGPPPGTGLPPPPATDSKDPVGFIAKSLHNATTSPQTLYMLAGMGINTAMQNMPKLANSFMDLLQAMQGDTQPDPGALATPAEPPTPGGPPPGGPPPPGAMPPPGMVPGMGAPPPGIPPQVLAMAQLAARQRMGLG